MLKLPVGKPIAFVGDIRSVDPDAYGFFYCKIKSPATLRYPILQRKFKTKDGVRTIAGLGSWEGWIFSMEMDNAKRFGYEFEIIRGYKFKSEIIFKNYVLAMYKIRLDYPKKSAMNLIAKLLMNCIYGKFGMKNSFNVVEMFDFSDDKDKILFNDFLDSHGELVLDQISLDNLVIVIRRNASNYKYDENFDPYHAHDVNVAIASAITQGVEYGCHSSRTMRNTCFFIPIRIVLL